MEKTSIRQSNKGFTLVEICVVMVLITILATITTMSLIRWQEYSVNRTMDDNAELIYMAARNKIAQLKSDNTLDELKYWGSNGGNIAVGISYNKKYHLIEKTNVTNGTNVSDDEIVYYLICGDKDYQDYLNNDLTEPDKILLFDILNDYSHDKDILKANIAIEYSEDGTIFSVYYSDRTPFGYGNTYEVNLTSSLDTSENNLYEKVIGLYSTN